MKIFNPVSFAKINSQDYLLAITPSEEITARICAFKDQAKKLIGCFPSFNNTRITVNHYYDHSASFTEKKLTCYDQKLRQEKPLPLKVCGFDYVNHQNTYTIYVKVVLTAEAEAAFAGFEKTADPGVPTVPHIIIAKSLSAGNFEKLWKHFKNVHFESFFYADKIVMLKMPARKINNVCLAVEQERHLKNAV